MVLKTYSATYLHFWTVFAQRNINILIICCSQLQNQITGQIEASNLRAAARLFDYFREQDNNTKCALLEQKVEGEDENADPQGSRKTPELRADKYVALMLESFEKNNQLALLLSSASEQEILEAGTYIDIELISIQL